MPGPPTPLSGCPLKRLEIHDRSTSRVYDTIQLANSLTFTLEAQRLVNAVNHSLVLQVHCGLQRVLSIKLTDLLRPRHDEAETISTERRSQRLCINVHQQGQTILADFEETRDFNVAVCMLKKFGFQVKDEISASFTRASSQPTSPLHLVPPGANFGPRLSAITPLPEPDSLVDPEVHQAFSFTSMLNSDFIPAHSDHVYQHFDPTSSIISSQFMQASPSQNPQQAPSSMASHPYLNPYNVFLGKQGNYFHQPRVSSPLRHSFDAETPTTTTPTITFSHLYHANQSPTRALQNHRSFSAPIIPSSSLQRLDYSIQEPWNKQTPPAQDLQSSDLESLSEAKSGTSNTSPVSMQDFRELMPRPRSLPFVRRQKIADKITTSKTTHKQAESSVARQRAGTSRNKEAQMRPRGGSKDNRTIHKVSKKNVKKDAPTQSSVEISNAECQTESPPTSSHPAGPLSDSPAQQYLSSQAAEVPTMLVADTAMLQRANEAISRLLQQYEADVAGGCDEAACAQFYVEQIHAARRDFWLTQLMNIESVGRMAPV